MARFRHSARLGSRDNLGAELVNTAPSSTSSARDVTTFSLSTSDISGALQKYLGVAGPVSTAVNCRFVAGSNSRRQGIIENAVISAIRGSTGLNPPDLRSTNRLELSVKEVGDVVQGALGIAQRNLEAIGDVRVVVNGRVVKVPSFCT